MHYSLAHKRSTQTNAKQYAKMLNWDFLLLLQWLTAVAATTVELFSIWVLLTVQKAWKKEKKNLMLLFNIRSKEGNCCLPMYSICALERALHPTSRYSLIANARLLSVYETMHKYSYNEQIESKTKTLTTAPITKKIYKNSIYEIEKSNATGFDRNTNELAILCIK